MNGRREVSRLKARLDATFSRAPTPASDPEVQADYAKYLCVLVSGFFESAIVALIFEYVGRRSAPEVVSFVERELKFWTNPNAEKISLLFGAFSADWRKSIDEYVVDERRDSVNSLVALRHKIAHGESVGTTMHQIKEHYKAICNVVSFLAELTDPT